MSRMDGTNGTILSSGDFTERDSLSLESTDGQLFTDSHEDDSDISNGQLKNSTERNLEIAAEFGKVLLRENEDLKQVILELRAKNEDLILSSEKELEQYSQKLETSNQERHTLRLQLDSLKAEHNTALADLRHDYDDVRRQLEEERTRAKNKERAQSELITELTAQNERLAEDLLSSTQLETEVKAEGKLRVGRSDSVEEGHLREVANFTAEIDDLRKEMALRVKLKTDECAILTADVMAASERIESLEAEHQKLMEELEKSQSAAKEGVEEVRRLEDINMQLLTKLENISRSAAPGAVPSVEGETSLFAELEILSQSMSVDSFDGRSNGGPLFGSSNAPSNGYRVTIGTQLKQEILELYRQLQRLSLEVRGRGAEWSPEAVDIEELKAGQLLLMLTELRAIMYEKTHTDKTSAGAGYVVGDYSYVDDLKRQIKSLKETEADLQSKVNIITAELQSRDKQLQRRTDEVTQTTTRLTAATNEIKALRAARDELRDRAVGSMSADENLRLAREERDAAYESNIILQNDLSQARLDLTALDRQLLNAVDQKLRLSQQLEAWQSDMHELINSKMIAEIEQDSVRSPKKVVKAASGAGSSPSPARRKFSLWH